VVLTQSPQAGSFDVNPAPIDPDFQISFQVLPLCCCCCLLL
jgi:hypothetical protein